MEHGRIPNRLKKYRRLAGLSTKKVAKLLSVGRSSLSRWEKGYTTPSAFQLFQLCVLYEALPHHLYFEVWETLKKEFAPTFNLSMPEQLNTPIELPMR